MRSQRRVRGFALAALLGFGMVLLFVNCSVVRLVFSGGERNSYYPLSIGSAWEYHLVTTVEAEGKTDTTTRGVYHQRIVQPVTLADGKPAVMRVWNSSITLCSPGLPESSFTQAETSYYRKTASAVYRYQTLQDTPDSVLLLPIQLDQRWLSKDVSYWVSAIEDVTVGGKTWQDCWCIQSRAIGSQGIMKAWIARGAGLVRLFTEREFSGKKMITDYFLVRADIRD